MGGLGALDPLYSLSEIFGDFFSLPFFFFFIPKSLDSSFFWGGGGLEATG